MAMAQLMRAVVEFMRGWYSELRRIIALCGSADRLGLIRVLNLADAARFAIESDQNRAQRVVHVPVAFDAAGRHRAVKIGYEPKEFVENKFPAFLHTNSPGFGPSLDEVVDDDDEMP
jgi:hypothetical protein